MTIGETRSIKRLANHCTRSIADLLEHVEHIRLAAQDLPSLLPGDRQVLLGRILDFLGGELAMRSEDEEHELYPRIARAYGDPRLTASLVADHDAIRHLTFRLNDASVDEVPLLQELLCGLHALITLHSRKEEALDLPLLGRPAPTTT